MNKCGVCTPNTNIQVGLDSFKHRCIYHKRVNKNRYNFGSIAPRHLCPDLFFTAYPYCLAFLYDAVIDGKRNRVLSCPNPEANVKIRVQIKPRIVKPIFNKLESLARKYWRPLSLTDKRIILKIVSVDGNCPRKHTPNQQFEFNISFFPELCPASFHSIYPFVFLIARKMSSRFSDTENSIHVGCPDAKNAVTYKIEKKEV